MPELFFEPVMTLSEYLKGMADDAVERPFIEMFAESSDIAQAIPFKTITGPTFRGYRETALQASMGFRGINAAPTSGTGVLAAYQEALFYIDHQIKVDRILVDGGNVRRRALEEKMAMARLGEIWVNTFLKGDNSVVNTEFNGLQKRSEFFGRKIDNAAGVAGGAALSLSKLDAAIHRTARTTHIISPWDLMPRWTQAARTQSLSGYVIQTPDSYGKPKTTYAGLPILFGYEIDLHPPILPFTEVAPGGGSPTTSSIYVVSFGENDLCALQQAPMEVKDLGLLQDNVTYASSVHWAIGAVDNSHFCMTRLAGIQNAPFVL